MWNVVQTGNYGWLNLLILLLCLPCWESDVYFPQSRQSRGGGSTATLILRRHCDRAWQLGAIVLGGALLLRSVPALVAIQATELSLDQLFLHLWHSFPHVWVGTAPPRRYNTPTTAPADCEIAHHVYAFHEH
jgi:hypothetical protein